MKGLVFDIRRFSVNDGPGIRTTVFLKGCPLRCWWCHNPESWSCEPEYMEVSQPLEGISFKKIETVGRWMSVAEVVEISMRDLAFMSESGGGVTLSGGEPLMQPEFSLALAREISRLGIHVALDTSGYAPRSLLSTLFPYVRLWLYDFKGFNPQRHYENTGVDNTIILENLDYLIRQQAPLVLRYPLVPGFNDTEQDISGLFHLLLKYKGGIREVHLLPHHQLGRDKRRRLHVPGPTQKVMGDSAEAAHRVLTALIPAGVMVKIGG
ncbi:MAG: glycyl-radical enzyme activating protein [Bacteroidales bacterium]